MREQLKQQWLRELEAVDLGALMKEYPSAYLYSARMLEERCSALRAAIPREVDIFYSLKANPNVHLTRRMARHIDGAEVSSAGELATARAAGFVPERILLVGPAKTSAELDEAVRIGVRAIVVESLDELVEVAYASEQQRKRTKVLLRINPHQKQQGAKLTMAGVSSQFGLDPPALPEAFDLIARRASWLMFEGFHVYLGTRFLSAAQIVANTEYIFDLCMELERAHGVQARSLDIGGGLGVPYFEGEPELDLRELGAAMTKVVTHTMAGRRLRLVLETGRYLVAEAGLYATRVRYVKRSKGETWVLTHGGINHFYAGAFMGQLLRRNFPIAVLTHNDSALAEPANVCGPLCTPGDLLASKVTLPRVAAGDVIGILCAGAYAFSTSPQLFLSHDAPPELMLEDGTLRLIRPVRGAEQVLAEQLSVSDF
jgi:diaminopimelate decarboxylase